MKNNNKPTSVYKVIELNCCVLCPALCGPALGKHVWFKIVIDGNDDTEHARRVFLCNDCIRRIQQK